MSDYFFALFFFALAGCGAVAGACWSAYWLRMRAIKLLRLRSSDAASTRSRSLTSFGITTPTTALSSASIPWRLMAGARFCLLRLCVKFEKIPSLV